MANKFNPDDLRNPVYEYSQVVTIHDLRIIYTNLAHQYKESRRWQSRKRLHLMLAGHVIHELISWLADGKPSLIK